MRILELRIGPGLFDGEDLICRDVREPLNGAVAEITED
jgi:hypothetical protein